MLKIDARPRLSDASMVLAFSGWMDGGDVSTGTVEWLVQRLQAKRFAQIEPEGFYLYGFPGSMEVSALFRPHARISDGLVEEFRPPDSTFHCDEATGLVLFNGKEPHLRWETFADCIFSLASEVGVSTLYFVGSFAGAVPHTREPRLTSTVSEQALTSTVEQYGLRLGSYEGPASFATCLLAQASARGLKMASVVAEIPPYLQGTNPKAIEAVIRKLAAMLDLPLDLEDLRAASTAWEHRVNEALEDNEELTGVVRKLEEGYDGEVFDTELGDLKAWLEQKGLRVD